jgi:NAD(P)-dependent dehydrogenase (short-subunit alcohol dehydrogenase family)
MVEASRRGLEERVAIVTGGGRGIGRAYCERLAAYGARVVVNDSGGATDGAPTDQDPAAEVVAAIREAGGDAVALRGDVSSTTVGRELTDLAIDTWGRLDIVINNAGIGRPRMVFNLAEDEWDDVVRVHLKGTFAVSQPACRWWRAQAKEHGTSYGRVINTATGLLVYGGAGQSNYVAAKAGIAAFTEAIATEMAPYGVTANAIMPSAATRLAKIGWRMERNAAASATMQTAEPASEASGAATSAPIPRPGAASTASATMRTAEPASEASGAASPAPIPRPGAASAASATMQKAEPASEASATMNTDPVHVAEFGCFLASDAAAWISGQTFQVRGATIEHIGTWRVDRTITRETRGWTAPELAQELPRAFGAGPKRSDPPPKEWSDEYHSGRD